jgi:hypothetical protein
LILDGTRSPICHRSSPASLLPSSSVANARRHRCPMPDTAHTRPPVPLHVPTDPVPYPRSCACVCATSISILLPARSARRTRPSAYPPSLALIGRAALSSAALLPRTDPNIDRDLNPVRLVIWHFFRCATSQSPSLGASGSAARFRFANPLSHFLHVSYLQSLLAYLERHIDIRSIHSCLRLSALWNLSPLLSWDW